MAIDYNHRERNTLRYINQKERVDYYAYGVPEPIVSKTYYDVNPWESSEQAKQPVSIVNGYELVGYHNPEDATRAAQQTSAAVWREILSKA